MAFTASKGDKYHLTNQTIKKRMALTNVKDIRDKGKKGCEFVKSL